MRIKKDSVSGTGNGIGKENVPALVSALEDFEKLIRAMRKKYLKEPGKTFDGQYSILNNWHNSYKVSLTKTEFPWHLCNGVDPYYCGWNSIVFISRWPLRFQAPAFNGGTSENMALCFTTEVSLSKSSFKMFLENNTIPEELKVATLRELKNYYTEKVKTRYKNDVQFWNAEANRRKIAIEERTTQNELDTLEIPKIKQRIKLIEHQLNSFAAPSPNTEQEQKK